jgi:hypothetical protein
MVKKCEFRTKNGERCRADAQTGKSLSVFHDPARASEGRRARRAGGITRSRLATVLPADTPDHSLATRQMQKRFSNGQGWANIAKRRAFLGQLQGLRMERSYVYGDDRVIRRLTQMGNFKQDDSMTYNEQGDEATTVTIKSGVDKERSEFRYLYQYDSHGNWTERTTINTDQPGDPNIRRRTLAYY